MGTTFAAVCTDAGFSEMQKKGAKEAGPTSRFSALENWDTLCTSVYQQELAIEGYKGGSAGIGTGPVC